MLYLSETPDRLFLLHLSSLTLAELKHFTSPSGQIAWQLLVHAEEEPPLSSLEQMTEYLLTLDGVDQPPVMHRIAAESPDLPDHLIMQSATGEPAILCLFNYRPRYAIGITGPSEQVTGPIVQHDHLQSFNLDRKHINTDPLYRALQHSELASRCHIDDFSSLWNHRPAIPARTAAPIS